MTLPPPLPLLVNWNASTVEAQAQECKNDKSPSKEEEMTRISKNSSITANPIILFLEMDVVIIDKEMSEVAGLTDISVAMPIGGSTVMVVRGKAACRQLFICGGGNVNVLVCHNHNKICRIKVPLIYKQSLNRFETQKAIDPILSKSSRITPNRAEMKRNREIRIRLNQSLLKCITS